MQRITLDKRNNQFTAKILNYFNDLKPYSTPYLEWLSMEHYQFSLNNTRFLMTSHMQTKSLIDQGVSKALLDNYNEEKNHARMYQHALKKIGLDVSRRIPFAATKQFFTKLETMIQCNASRTLGVMYATETAAIFEHTLFKKISDEIYQRHGLRFTNSRLKQFHDLHLDGVEQAHKDELGIFIDHTKENVDPNIYLQEKEVLDGAFEAIEAMEAWWSNLIKVQEQLDELNYA
ncbi:DUF3865 domain-containing protein [Legionella gresilensis]|uniref:DUF3865 domain-containing protein n=1 Tax=Legionella gresilensis TaxID=91823 RepID=UPI0010412584|nr:DUF3865 domain-containing protein [Legionella gresilensis]